MATGPADTKAQIAIIPDTKCELCEENDIVWKCFNCEENMYMCNICKKAHLKSKATRNHKVTTVKGADKQEQQGHEDKQGHHCSLHPQENISLFCKECDVLVCSDCIVSGSHKNHTFLKLKDIIDERQRELSMIIDKSNQKLSEFEQNMKSITQNNIDFSKDISKCIEDVKSKNIKLKATLDQITFDIIAKLHEIEKQNKEKNRKKEKETEHSLSELKEMIDKCKDKQSKRETELIQFVKDVKQRLDQFKPYDPPDTSVSPVFVSKDVDVEEVKGLFGYLQLKEEKRSDYERSTTASPTNTNPTIDVKVVSTFTMKKNLNIVAAVSDTQAWLGFSGYDNKKETILVTSHGKKIQTLNTDFDMYDMAVTKTGELLFTMDGGNKVKKLTSDGIFVDVYVDLAGYKTRGITVTDNNYFIVCLCNKATSEGKLVQLSPAGQQITTIQYDRDSETCLFNDPLRVSSNRNGDLIVVSQLGVFIHYIGVVVVDKTGHKRFTYTGQMEVFKNFDPLYTVTDQYGHIIISDNSNSSLHLLDKDGNCLQILQSDKHGIRYPYGMSIDKSGRLWVCDHHLGSNSDSKVVLVKYV